ncbi:MAG TPA: alpha-glucan family phosphorylase [Cyclobacteriaceae bacterium]|nr:alpha-glucan family phosphorylase [Cyclobacteriaceae bacterium]
MASTPLPRVAYFCMEYALQSDFKMYAGGLGILAGDYLKGANDHRFPIVGIGIKWKQGYTDQRVSADGKVIDSYPIYDYPFLKDTGITVSVTIRKRNVKCKVWLCDSFRNAPLYLLDTDVPGNEDSWISGQLYGWFGEERIAQEMVLGIGGVKALRALKIPVDVYHFNEGHALFAGFELVREKMERRRTFDQAVAASREEIVFTTHTPVVQGNESHYLDRLLYMGADNGAFTKQQLKQLGGSPFNMTVGALRLSRKANAVAQLHAVTANKMWKDVDGRAEIIGITNAIHLPTWVDRRIINAAKRSTTEIGKLHQENKRNLLSFIYDRTGVRLKQDGLLLGFSRRAVPYKRSDFIFSDRSKVDTLFKSGKLQIVFSGKAHPLDDGGKKIVANIVALTKKYPRSVVFLENYDMLIGSMLVRGSDVWLNNPRRPQEASGTSGMKAAMNGVLNLSILDGWWPEACQHGVNGWQIGDGYENSNEKKLDAHDQKAFYKVLLNEVVPTYYQDRKRWVEMMKQSVLTTYKQFAVKRMLDEYYNKLYKKME